MKLSDTLNGYGLSIKLICLLVISLLSAYAGHWATNSHWQTKWTERDNADLTAQIAADKRELDLQTEWQKRIDKVSQDGKKAAELLEANIDNLAAVNDKLRESAKVSASKHESANSIITELRRTAATSELVRRELLGYCLGRVESLATAFDRSRAAGLACEKAYQGIRL